MADQIDEIRARIDIVGLVGQTVALKRAGKDYKGLCPFHEDKNPSFQVSSSLGRYRCWACGESGDIFTWVMKTQRVEFPEALRMLAEQAGVTLQRKGSQTKPSERVQQLAIMGDALFFFREQLAKNEEARAYCERRGLDSTVQADWELGYAPEDGMALATYLKRKGHTLADCRGLFLVEQADDGGYYDKFRSRLIFPIRDEKGDLVAFGGRLLGDGHPKYINSSDTPLYRKSRVLYGMFRAKDQMAKERKAVLTEGYLDVIACHRGGVTNALASLGTALAEDHARLLKRWCEGVIVLYDSDAAGQKAAERAIEVLETEGVKVRIAVMPQGEDPDTLLQNGGPAALTKAIKGGLKPLDYRLFLLKQRLSPQQDEFWPEAVQIIAGAPSELDVGVYVLELAPSYPYLKDKKASVERLLSDVAAIRTPSVRPRRAKSEAVHVRLDMAPAEKIVFRAFLSEALRIKAYQQCKDQDLFETSGGSRIAAEISSFAKCPEGPPANWLHEIGDAEISQLLSDLSFSETMVPVNEAALDGAIAWLQRKQQQRLYQEMKSATLDDARRLEILEMLKELQRRLGQH